MEYRTIKEAMALEIPPIPKSLANEVTQLCLTLSTENSSPVNKVRKVYEMADRLTKVVQEFSVCSKGCDACCKMDVGILPIEAKYIAKSIGVEVSNCQSRKQSYDASKTPCTFLGEDGSCTIYEFRPLVCRTFFTFDNPMLCEEMNTPHSTYRADSNILIQNLARVLISFSRSQPCDIRDFFPTACRSD